MNKHLILALLDEGYSKKTWHGPNLRQSLKGVTVKQAAWRPGSGRHNIWELTLHAAYWKYAVRRRLEGAKRGSFVLKGSNFFPRPEQGKATEAAWRSTTFTTPDRSGCCADCRNAEAVSWELFRVSARVGAAHRRRQPDRWPPQRGGSQQSPPRPLRDRLAHSRP